MKKRPSRRKWWRSPRFRRGALFACALAVSLSIALGPTISLATSPPDPLGLSRQGAELYQAGELERAARAWRAAAEAFAGQGDRLNRAMALGNLALTERRRGGWEAARAAIAASLEHLRATPETPERARVEVQTLEVLGELQLATGALEDAAETWRDVAERQDRLDNRQGVARARVERARALEELGLNPRARDILLAVLGIEGEDGEIPLEELAAIAEGVDSLSHLDAARELGEIFRAVGQLERSRAVLEGLPSAAERVGSREDIAAAYLSLGNTERAIARRAATIASRQAEAPRHRQAALECYRLAAELGEQTAAGLLARSNRVSLLVEEGDEAAARALVAPTLAALEELPPGRERVRARVHLARASLELGSPEDLQQGDRFLRAAIERAREFGDRRLEAHAWGTRGALEERRGDWERAERFTRAALELAPALEAPEIAYRDWWQLGRVERARGNREEAIAAHERAVTILESLRSDLAAVDRDARFDFREEVEPVYRQLVELLLAGDHPSAANLERARELIEASRVAELDNFFRDACVEVNPVVLDQIDPSAAVIYPIILSDRLAVILSLPGRAPRFAAVSEPRERVEKAARELRASLLFTSEREEARFFGELLHEWLIRPFEADLERAGVETLVFALDGPLQNLPMAALRDGQSDRDLVEKYAIAVAPGLRLLDPKPLEPATLQVFAAGLTEARQDFPPLPGVEIELERVEQLVPTRALLDREFTTDGVREAIDAYPYPVVHLATHGTFSSRVEDTFILTWDDRLNIDQLRDVLRRRDLANGDRPLELLVLSACETAFGDERAALGLAGFAAAGARGTLASLWQLDDEAGAKAIGAFYEALREPGVTKAEALARAQRELLEDPTYRAHPYYWASLVLVGNWL